MPTLRPAAIMPTPIAAATTPNARLSTVPFRSGRRSSLSTSASGVQPRSRGHPRHEDEERGEPERDDVEGAGPSADDRGSTEHAERDAAEPGDDEAPPAGP